MGKSLLREMGPVRQIRGEPRRRWFASDRCDLIVWLDHHGELEGFQFCYDKDERVEHAATWRPSRGFSHMRVDYGRRSGTPFLVPNGVYDAERMLQLFEREAELLPAEVVAFVSARLRALAPETAEPAQ